MTAQQRQARSGRVYSSRNNGIFLGPKFELSWVLESYNSNVRFSCESSKAKLGTSLHRM